MLEYKYFCDDMCNPELVDTKDKRIMTDKEEVQTGFVVELSGFVTWTATLDIFSISNDKKSYCSFTAGKKSRA